MPYSAQMAYPEPMRQPAKAQNKDEELEIDLTEPKKNPEPHPKKPHDQQINKQVQQLVQNNKPHDKIPRHPNDMYRYPAPVPPPKPKQSNVMINYVIIPIIIILVFVSMVHPKTSKIINKYLPPMEKISGMFARGLILAIVYVVARLLTEPKKN